MEKILILNGSPKGKKGNTAKLVDNFILGVKDEISDFKIDYVELKDKEINGCTGCFSCWEKTPGKCIFRDSMDELIPKLLKSDMIIWATPLYHYGMTSLTKRFIERTLPLAKPEIVDCDGVYGHPGRYEVKEKKEVLISTAGFPEDHNFEVLIEEFNKVASIDERILTVMGELLSVKALERRIAWYLEAVRQSGREFVKEASFSDEIKQTLKKPLVPMDDFLDMANSRYDEKEENKYKSEQGYHLLNLMKHTFNPKGAGDLECILEFEFTDTQEVNHFIIKDRSCELKKGKSGDFRTKVVTTTEVWREISDGRLDGAKAMMDGLYKVEGDFKLMMELDNFFGSGDDDDFDTSDISIEAKESSFLTGIKAMNLSFIPWIFSWIFIERSLFLGIVLPLLVSLVIVFLKRNKYEVSYFERSNLLYFSILSIIGLLGYVDIKNIGIELNHFSIAAIWLTSVFINKPLTSEYSKYDYPKAMEKNPIFIRTNNIITLFWVGIFFIQVLVVIALKSYGYMNLSPLLYLLIILGLKFTGFFSNYYPEYLAKR
ncbi:NAD(P)H-dependent oxidoreductase [Halonatronum saccharophilum]|uniref:NAD(P)H-dependent oxidoreductase n=1 Tax=Halonatronum saccharophilum TaxID=150060 RepID=UPI000482A671|nr:NAD(P)H-dependent oxidoreductase [Halonatronum saccharophilum]